MKILRIITRMNIGGPAIHVSLLNEAMNQDKEFEEFLLYGSLSEYEGDMSYLLDKGKKHYSCQLSDLKRGINLVDDYWAFKNIFKIIKDYKPDIVHTHTAKAGALGRLAVMLYNVFFNKKVKIVHTFHGNVFYGYFSKPKSLLFLYIERILAKFTDVIIAISKKQQREIYFKYKLNSRIGVKLILLGFDLRKFKDINASIFQTDIGTVGRLTPIKNHKLFLDAAKIYNSEYNNFVFEQIFTIVGNGELMEELIEYSKENEIYCSFTGWINKAEFIYSKLGLFCLTSLNEGTPVALIEAMASGVPTISTNVGGVKDLYGEEVGNRGSFIICERGILIKKSDPEDLAIAMSWVMNWATKDELSGMANNAKKYVLENYNKERLIFDMKKLYRETMEW